MKISRRNRSQLFIPIASMGDIAFLLIIFFMLTSIFLQEAHLDAAPARSLDIEELSESMVSVVLDSSGNLWLQGVACPPDSLESAVAVLIAHREDKTVMLKVDRERPYREYGDIMMALSEAGAEIALIGTRGSAPEQGR